MLVELLRSVFGIVPPLDARVHLGNEVLRNLVPVEVRADTVIVLEGESSSMAMIVESQLDFDPSKLRVWPAYVALLHRTLGIPVLLVVITLDQKTAEKCRQPITIGPGFVLRPLVLGPSDVPSITDPESASRNPALAVLSTLAHADNVEPAEAAAIAFAAVRAIEDAPSFDDERKRDYHDIVCGALGEAASRLLEELMNQGEPRYQSKFARRYFDEGAAQGKVEGKVEGKAEGKAEAEVEAVLEVLAARGIAVAGEPLARIRACGDLEVLRRWLRRAAVANSLSEVFDD